MATVRYLVHDVGAAADFYAGALGFVVKQRFGAAIAILARGDLTALMGSLRAKGIRFRNEIVEGPGGKQILCEDPSGNVVELFEPAR